MVCRYFILSGIPMSRMIICDEIQSMVSFVVENLNYDWDVFEFITEDDVDHRKKNASGITMKRKFAQ